MVTSKGLAEPSFIVQCSRSVLNLIELSRLAASHRENSGVTTGGNGGSRLRAPIERGRRVLAEIIFLFY